MAMVDVAEAQRCLGGRSALAKPRERHGGPTVGLMPIGCGAAELMIGQCNQSPPPFYAGHAPRICFWTSRRHDFHRANNSANLFIELVTASGGVCRAETKKSTSTPARPAKQTPLTDYLAIYRRQEMGQVRHSWM